VSVNDDFFSKYMLFSKVINITAVSLRCMSLADTPPAKQRHSRLLLPVLGVSAMAVWLVTVAFGLLLIDFAQSFNVSVGTAGITASVGSVSGIVFGLLMAVLCCRVNHKLLLLLGLTGTALAALVYYFAPNFDIALLANIGVGGGIAMVTSMVYSLVGDFYPVEKRGRAIGFIAGVTSLAYVIGAPLVGVIVDVSGSWRTVMIWLSLPVTLACMILAFLVIPNKPHIHEQGLKEPFFAGCKQALTTRPTVAALSVTMFMFAESSIGFYAVSFFRSQYAISIDTGSLVLVLGSLVATSAGIIAGLAVNRVGRKRLGSITCVVAALFTLAFTFMPEFWASWLFSNLRNLFGGMAVTAGSTLVIEQLPKFRSTMVSLNSAFMNIGMLIGSMIAAFALNLYNYQTLALILGSIGVLGSAIWLFLVNEPCKKPAEDPLKKQN
jgi:predicted MFS family arabinose efflux permease